MSKHIVKGYVTVMHDRNTGKSIVGFQVWKPSPEYSPDTVVVGEGCVEVEVPDNFDIRPAMVKNLQAKRETARAEFVRTIQQIDEQIQSLLAIEHTS
ncbi:hypothetical protein C8245_23035 [Paracidovorax avenae]|uniref:hypothetical protein n=1 Tax=Paracidovorax avenae TaxID=80867 RepID=UPI000D21A384|nr:hypothetical protein [Paracidovorax avenae]AVS68152.1 hypothetical protein C8245_23035 [Paracidovorax avenae]